ncbi:endonuclease/exonuclease/phosphatase family metal-dependent hydrolase [Geodermatophilus tzadiensis]|uniref:Endonuclease/exonuclease/phosphatase family metal-dependent hydrolase n=1 Tax=Geodermatophilus tzadiensis TaxID=1137988 RepID=A0A2T0ST96_9ACTN|nr:endonuclease/exonuclease/phosphatase family protein [Geodermatophilus tzadiensis]PRY36618.1 endonuclease/exonuclease/phosphatase family metal-dependent hydrolase [Geodermatophilus tzadiensis]
MPDGAALRVGTLNLASGRGHDGRVLTSPALAAAVADLDVDVLAVQEVDTCQPRSGGTDQAAVLAGALGAADWRAAATLDGTPSPFRRTWTAAEPALRGPRTAGTAPAYGIALVSRLPVRRWEVLGLGAGRARLPLRAPDPTTGRPRLWWIPDEPRVAVAACLDGLTVVGTHLSFAPPTSVGQLRRLRRWAASLPGPVVLAGDLNLPGGLPARLAGATRLVSEPSFPAAAPRTQLDHLLALGDGLAGSDPAAHHLRVGDHRALTVTVRPPATR